MDVVKWLSQFLFLIVQGIFYILYYVEVAFYWLAGAGNPLDVKVGDGQADAWMDSNIIIQLLTEPKQEQPVICYGQTALPKYIRFHPTLIRWLLFHPLQVS